MQVPARENYERHVDGGVNQKVKNVFLETSVAF